jgi:methylenetetrahydrofolate reductase (NADPH)
MSDNGYKAGSNLEKVLKAGHFAFTGECGPPKGANVEHLNEKMEHLSGVVDDQRHRQPDSGGAHVQQGGQQP